MGIVNKVKRALRGDVDAGTLALEVWRRSRAARRRRLERASLESLAGAAPACLRPRYAHLTPAELLSHFRNRTSPLFLPGCDPTADAVAGLQRSLFPFETAGLLERAARITDEHCWAILGYGEKHFGEKINWLKDPLSGALWPLEYHADVQLFRGDGSDARVLWEINRLSHLLTLARAYLVTRDEKYTREIFSELAAWREQNPVGRGANWACAMEAALRAMNLLSVFEMVRRSPELNEETLSLFLQTFDQHGAHIRRNLEFSYISTSNHYLSDVVGLLWLGLMLPELAAASEWRAFGLRETLREMEKQIHPDGADFEASTGYHRLVLELFLYTFILARENQMEIEEKYRQRLRAMLHYVRAYLKPEGRAPLIGDTDSGQILPLVPRSANDHAYVLALGAVLFDEPRFKLSSDVAAMPEELLWVLGEEGVRAFQALPEKNEDASSEAFTDAGTYILRDRDLYLLFNASGNGLVGRGSHGHNDALSLEVSACGTSFIVDPGTYVYSADLDARHLFRSVAAHSTLEVDGAEQNTTDPGLPFVIGDEAHPRVLRWETTKERDIIVAEHDGYKRLNDGVTHRRSVRFEKPDRLWMIEDSLYGAGEHDLSFRFHFAESLELSLEAEGRVRALDKMTGARLFILALDLMDALVFEPHFVSRDYGEKSASASTLWTVHALAPCSFRWALVPACAGEDELKRLSLIEKFRI
jgi:hypothetical protein